MADRYGISVIPVRQALKVLGEEGLVTRQRGRGTFVSERVRVLDGATSLESLYSREFTKAAQVLERGTIPVPTHLTGHFPDATALVYVRRLAYRNEEPWSYGVLYFLLDYAAEITTSLLQRWPVYRIMRERCGVEVARSKFDAQAIGASADMADHLCVDPLSPVLSLRSVSFDRADRAIGAFEMIFPSAPFTFSFETVHELV